MLTIILIVLVVLFISGVPTWSHSREWGYGPSSVLGFILVIMLIWILFGGGRAHLGHW